MQIPRPFRQTLLEAERLQAWCWCLDQIRALVNCICALSIIVACLQVLHRTVEICDSHRVRTRRKYAAPLCTLGMTIIRCHFVESNKLEELPSIYGNGVKVLKIEGVKSQSRWVPKVWAQHMPPLHVLIKHTGFLIKGSEILQRSTVRVFLNNELADLYRHAMAFTYSFKDYIGR